jgi:hypothetical protein
MMHACTIINSVYTMVWLCSESKRSLLHTSTILLAPGNQPTVVFKAGKKPDEIDACCWVLRVSHTVIFMNTTSSKMGGATSQYS